jgi:hypothetical protein
VSTASEHPVDQDFIRVSAAKKRYFGGAMSLRWWYKQIESGRLPHFRAGGAVLLRPADVETFVAAMFRDGGPVEPEPQAAQADPAPPSTRPALGRRGLRFFST